jgi:hypothetical protein
MHTRKLFPMVLVVFLCSVAFGSLSYAATISGTVQDDGGNPIANLQVFAADYTTNAWIANDYTDSNGDYAITGLSTGTYRVKACASCTGLSYVDEFYDNVFDFDFDNAMSVSVTAPDETPNIDFILDGGTISGTIYASDGTTPLAGVDLEINPDIGDPCDPFGVTTVGGDQKTNPDGTYTIVVPPGTYYLRLNNQEANYIEEWWAISGSVRECSLAETVTVLPGEAVTDKDFQLEPGAIISGTVYEMDGITPLIGTEEIAVMVISGDPCGLQLIAGDEIEESNGTYTLEGIPTGTYYVRTYNVLGYINEWWDGSPSTPECLQAAEISVTVGDNISGIDFSLGVYSEPNPITSSGRIVSLPDGSASVDFPPGAIPAEVFVSIAMIDETSVPPSTGGFELLGSVYEFSAVDAGGQSVTDFTGFLTITLQYDPADLGGLDELSLTIQYYDELLASWVPIPSVVNTGNHTVTGTTDHFTWFGVFGVPEPSTCVLFGLGLVGLAAFAWKRR